MNPPGNTLQRLEWKIDRTRENVARMDRRVQELERQGISRRAILTFIIGVGPTVTGAIVLVVALGDRLWGP